MYFGTAARGSSSVHSLWAFSRWFGADVPRFYVYTSVPSIESVRQERERQLLVASMQRESINCLRYGSAAPKMHLWYIPDQAYQLQELVLVCLDNSSNRSLLCKHAVL